MSVVEAIETAPAVLPLGRSSQYPLVVSVGTDHHPFDRAVSWIDRWAVRRGLVDQVVIQRGTSVPALGVRSVDYLDVGLLHRYMRQGSIGVSHGGPSTIAQFREFGIKPIVVPRDPTRGEHVDDHQQRFARHMAAAGEVFLAETRADLWRLLDELWQSPQAARVVDDGHVRAAVAEVAEVAARLVASG